MPVRALPTLGQNASAIQPMLDGKAKIDPVGTQAIY
jgi:hypothetical protein